MFKYIVFLAVSLFLLYIIFYYAVNFKEGSEGRQISQAGNDYEKYYSPRENKINKLLFFINDLKSKTPITFAPGTITYDRKDKANVTFNGTLPYIFVNISLPYPLAGNQGERGITGGNGKKGDKGDEGETGRKGYVGSTLQSFAFKGN
jgi:hypothetical protein